MRTEPTLGRLHGTDPCALADHTTITTEFTLPPELLITILADPTTNYPTLLSACLVSRAWNACATPVLYNEVDMNSWDSRLKTTLFRTLQARPELHETIKTIRVAYPRLDEWVKINSGALMCAAKSRGFGPQADPGDDEERLIALELPNAVEAAHFMGAGDWLDAGERGDEPRREGACELVQFASRCTRLDRLVLRNFDFGNTGTTQLDLPYLPSVRILEWTQPHPSEDDVAAQTALLPLVPNLESLEIASYTSEIQPRLLFPKLRHLKLECLDRLGDFRGFDALLDRSAPVLRSLELLQYNFGEENLSRIIQRLPHLGSLSIPFIFRQYSRSHDNLPHPSILSVLPTARLTHLSLPYACHQPYLDALPPTLTSLGINIPDRDVLEPILIPKYLKDTMLDLVARRKTNLPRLSNVLPLARVLNHAGHLEFIWEDGRAAGLDVQCVRQWTGTAEQLGRR